MIAGYPDVPMPIAFMDDSSLRFSTRNVGMAIQLGILEGVEAAKLLCHSRIQQLVGGTKNTIRAALKQLEKSKWPIRESWANGYGPTVDMAGALIVDQGLTWSAKILYGLLVVAPRSADDDNERLLRYSALHGQFGFGLNTVKRCIMQLRLRKWLVATQQHKHDPLHARFNDASESLYNETLSNIEGNPNLGEALALAMLTAQIDDRNFSDHVYPRDVPNPDTGNPLSFDRMYHALKIAFEFNGPQHYHKTQKYDAATVAAQKRRDAHRKKICDYLHTTLITLQKEDLIVENLREKLSGKLPLRDPRSVARLLNCLSRKVEKYLAKCRF